MISISVVVRKELVSGFNDIEKLYSVHGGRYALDYGRKDYILLIVPTTSSRSTSALESLHPFHTMSGNHRVKEVSFRLPCILNR